MTAQAKKLVKVCSHNETGTHRSGNRDYHGKIVEIEIVILTDKAEMHSLAAGSRKALRIYGRTPVQAVSLRNSFADIETNKVESRKDIAKSLVGLSAKL